jgi:hypothetical protein
MKQKQQQQQENVITIHLVIRYNRIMNSSMYFSVQTSSENSVDFSVQIITDTSY